MSASSPRPEACRLPAVLLGGVLLAVVLGPGCHREEPATAPAAVPAVTNAAPATVALREPPTLDLAGQDEAIVTAVEKATQLVRRNPDNADAWGRLGMVLLVHGFNQPAGVCLTEAARLDPAEVRWPYFLFSIVREADRPAALLLLRKAAANLDSRTLVPETRRAVRQRLAEALIEDGQAEAALTALVPEPEDKSPAPGHELLRARAQFQLGHWPEAQAHAETAATAPEIRHDALRLLAQLAQRRGDTAAAQAQLAEAARLSPWKRLDPLAVELEREGRGLRLDLQNANVLLNANRFAEVRQLLNQTVLLYPHSAYAWLTLGKAELAAARWERAETCFRKAIENDPAMVEAPFQLGQALRGQQRLAEAAASFRRGTELKHDSVPAQYMLGLTLTELGQPAEALPAFQVCVECRPQYAEAYLRLARVLAQLGQLPEAKSRLDSARRLAPFDAATTNLLRAVERELAAPH
jgi:tetratricopeptide (TPR) repeat protein